MALYDVFLRGKKIDTVYRRGDHDESDKVRRTLVQRDHWDREIVVKMQRNVKPRLSGRRRW